MSPSVRDWRLYADDIIEACGKIRRYVAAMSYEAFVADELRRDAVIRNIEIIGEAAKNLPDEAHAAVRVALRGRSRDCLIRHEQHPPRSASISHR